MSQRPYRHAFGDESGNLGFAFERGSTRFFVILMMLLNDPDPLRGRIKRLRSELGIPGGSEFKFRKTSDANRRSFLTAARSYPFVGYALALDKSKLSAEEQRMPEVKLYAACFARLVVQIPKGELGNTILVMDQFGVSRVTQLEVRRRLRNQGMASVFQPFKKVLMKRSKGEDLIQCADMLAGALMRELSKGDSRFFDLVRHKIVVWEY